MNSSQLVERIRGQARDVHLGILLLALLGWVLFAVGWVACQAVRAVSGLAVWTWAALVVGWRTARGETS